MEAARQHEPHIASILDRALSGKRLTREDGYALIASSSDDSPALFEAARALADAGHGRRVTFSAKVFVPLTTLCRDYCGYCTFRRDPGEPGARTMEIDEVVALCADGEKLGVKEALFSLGDRPEALFGEHRNWLTMHGHRTTLGYLRDACAAVVDRTSLLPHANPGLMGAPDLRALREVNASMGLMLESTSERLLLPGAAHDRAPDKVPLRRLATIEAAGALKIPFTTGILIGIGETPAERVDALLALRELHERYGHIQEVIVQNFRAKPTIRMRDEKDPSFRDLAHTLAVARLLLGPRMNLQAPPNLSPATYPALLRAGLNDWGGISPLTIDHINPEAPWPHLALLEQATASLGYELRERLAVYPEYVVGDGAFLHERMKEKMRALAGADGLARPELERWRQR
ncbi:MAG TPA: 7,8-didemethyl-8-hydroxy-5-deazariboflavin synthase CofG [Polyangiaceae bacterium]|nr:7,8-didemethyl-8-hydroxy-5-deazariboflavin synthase CofG [Polyangiaceae bacterium]